MKKNKTLLIVAVAFVAVMVGAAVFYNQATREKAPEEVAVPEETPVEQEPEQKEEEEKPTVTPPPVPEEPPYEKWKAPDFTVVDLDGNPVTLYEKTGKPMIISFWASWCTACIKEMKELEKAYAQYGDEVEFMLINMTDGGWDTEEYVAEIVAKREYKFPVYCDPEYSAIEALVMNAVPTTYFIDKEGYVVSHEIGVLLGDVFMEELVKILPNAEPLQEVAEDTAEDAAQTAEE